MGERLLCKQEVIGSIPFTSTTGGAKRAAVVCGDSRDSDGQCPSRERAVPRWGGGPVPYLAPCGHRDGRCPSLAPLRANEG